MDTVPARIPFWKLQSIGNDFPLIHLDDLDPSVENQQLPSLAVTMADRRFGVGGDGILAARKLGEHRVLLRMFNPDGTEDFCGNGLRVAALHAHTEGWVGNEFTILHLGREVAVTIGNGLVSTSLGGATYNPSDVPLREGETERFRVLLPNGRIGSSLSTGTTHTVIWVDSLPEDNEFFAESAALEVDPMFSERTSVMWAQPIAKDHIRLRIWERGVGETQGCGTGSTAAAVDYLRGENRPGRVQVDNPGGTVFVSWDPAINEPVIEGTAELVFRGDYLMG